MSVHRHEITRVCEGEVATRTIDHDDGQDVRAITRRWRAVRQSLVPGVAVLVGVCLAAGVALTDSGSAANARPVKAVERASAQQPVRETAKLKLTGYAPVACTLGGTLMRDYHTGQSVIIRL